MATQVQPPLVEKEIAMLFLNTLQEPYYDRLLPSVMGNFVDMIMDGNLVDHVVKNNKIEAGESSTKPKRSNFMKKKKGETQALFKKTNPINPEAIPRIRLTPTIHPPTTNHPQTTNPTIHP